MPIDYTTHAFTPGWKPTGFNSTVDIPLLRNGYVDDESLGIPGSAGRLFAFL